MRRTVGGKAGFFRNNQPLATGYRLATMHTIIQSDADAGTGLAPPWTNSIRTSLTAKRDGFRDSPFLGLAHNSRDPHICLLIKQ